MTVALKEAQRNQLLRGLPPSALRPMSRDFDLREMRVRDKFERQGHSIEFVCFPLSCVLSTIAKGAGGSAVEVATVGQEGMTGLPIFLGVAHSPTLDTFTQVAGEALWMRAREFRAYLDHLPRLRQIMGYYTQALLTQISQASACNRMHAADERCARWLLMTHDRVGRNEFGLTQEFLAQMLGVRRATVSEVAAELQAAGIIRYARGTVSILNREELERRSCECYRLIRDEYARLLPGRTPARSTRRRPSYRRR